MKKSPNKTRGASSRRQQERCFVPIHQDHVLESLAVGIVRLNGRRPAPIGSIGEADLSSDSHGFPYGMVGLLEVSTEGDQGERCMRDGYVLLSDCKALWLRSKEEVDELELLIPSFGDTVPSALVIDVDGSLFQRSAAGVARELFGGDPVAMEPEEEEAFGVGAGADGALIERLSGAVSLLRRRVQERGLPLASLGEMFSMDDATAVEIGSPVHRLADRVLRVAKPGGAPDEDARILAMLAEKLASMDFSEGIVPDEVLRELHRSVASADAGDQMLLAAIESLQNTMRKVAGNQLALSGAKIDDSGQVGLRGIMVFFLAPSPIFLSRWLVARPEVGNGVALVASLLVGLFAGHGRIPAAEKGPGKDAFLSSVRIAVDLAERSASIVISRSWGNDGSRSERIEVDGAEFAAVSEPAREEVRRFIQAANQAGAQPKVDHASGALTVRGSLGEQKFVIGAEVGKSNWRLVPASDVAVLQASVRLPGRGPIPKVVLESLLSPSMRPVWATLGGTGRAMTVSIEAASDEAEELRSAIVRLSDAISTLGLVPKAVGGEG